MACAQSRVTLLQSPHVGAGPAGCLGILRGLWERLQDIFPILSLPPPLPALPLSKVMRVRSQGAQGVSLRFSLQSRDAEKYLAGREAPSKDPLYLLPASPPTLSSAPFKLIPPLQTQTGPALILQALLTFLRLPSSGSLASAEDGTLASLFKACAQL